MKLAYDYGQILGDYDDDGSYLILGKSAKGIQIRHYGNRGVYMLGRLRLM